MLVVLGILHLAVTPLFSQLIQENVLATSIEWFTPPMLLNHVVVGILLLPLGVLTYYAASLAVVGERWALVVVRTTAVSVGLLPVTVFTLMGGRYFGAMPFLIATILVTSAAIVLLVAAFWSKTSSAT